MNSIYTSKYFKSILPERLARIITKRREYLNITQKELGVRCHLSEQMIKKMEKGRHDFRLTELEKLSFGLETSVKYFFAVL